MWQAAAKSGGGRSIAGLQHHAQYACELVGAGSATLLAVDAGKAVQGEGDRLAFQQGAERLEVAVTAGGVTEVADGAVHQVEIDLAGADEGRGNGRDVADTVHGGVAQDPDIFGHVRIALDGFPPVRKGSWT